MISNLQRLIGNITVKEIDDQIRVSGLPANFVTYDIREIWASSKIAPNMFTEQSRSSITFNKFFAPDVVYTLEQVLEQKGHRRNYRALQKVIDALYENTWLRKVRQTVPAWLKRNRLKELNVTLRDHQHEFLDIYEQQTVKYGLNGYLLGAVPGSGKTLMGISLSLCVDADVTFMIVPKNAVHDVWDDTLATRFHQTPKYWTSLSGKPLEAKYQYYVFHYEQLDRAIEFAKELMRNKLARNPVLIVDESHNFNELTAQRTLDFIALTQVLKCKHVLWASGTAIKAIGGEAMPLLMTIDPLFDQDAQTRFAQIYGKNAKRALDILANRIGLLSFKVEKGHVFDNQTETLRRDVTMPNSERYTLPAIAEEMRAFIMQRLDYYREHMSLYEELYFDGLAVFEKTLKTSADWAEYRQYRAYVEQLRKGYDAATMGELVAWCNQYEKTKIVPRLGSKTLRDDFLDARSVVKYYPLKVQGEALGRILGKRRAQCHVDMLPHMGLPEMIDASRSKTVIFTSYVEVVKAADVYLRGEGYRPLLVYGDTNSELKNITAEFAKVEDANPLIATYKSLSTAVPLTMASTAILTNAPFRDYEYTQATARVDRMGQPHPVTIWNVFLDTGSVPNISTRSRDIMQWSRDQVSLIMGTPVAPFDMAMEAFQELLTPVVRSEIVGLSPWQGW